MTEKNYVVLWDTWFGLGVQNGAPDEVTFKLRYKGWVGVNQVEGMVRGEDFMQWAQNM